MDDAPDEVDDAENDGEQVEEATEAEGADGGRKVVDWRDLLL